MKQTADRVVRNDYYLSCFGIGRAQMCFLTMSAMMGGNVRVGLEDSLMIGRGQLAKSNAEQVRKIRTILTEIGIQIATADEAREMLALKGGEQRSDERRVGKESDGEGRSRGTQY